MYESYATLKIKQKAGIETAELELRYRLEHRERLDLNGLNDVCLYWVPTPEIQSRLESVNCLYQKVSRKRKVKDVILLDAFHSATIEGARTTVENVRKVYDKPKTKDDKMVINTIRGLNYAYEHTVSMDNIRKLWEIVTQDVCENVQSAGTLFRNHMVYVGNSTTIIHVPAQPTQIEDMMKELFSFAQTSPYHVWLTACICHFYFVYVHPFCDGNGRMTRILMQSYLTHHGMEKVKFLPFSRTINQNLSGYYMSLRESEYVIADDSPWIDVTPFVDYMLGVMEECMVTSMREDNVLSDRQKILLSKMQKRGKGAEITVATAADILKLSQSTVLEYLNALTKMGYLSKSKRGRKNIYTLQ